jgi:hypothetical protein
VAVPSEHGNEPSVYINGGVFLDYMNDYQLLRNISAVKSMLSNAQNPSPQISCGGIRDLKVLILKPNLPRENSPFCSYK